MEEKQIIHPIQDHTRVIRNPAMGWVLYIDAFSMYEIQEFPEAEAYWAMQDGNVDMASIFYLRVPWSIMEPEEGEYAWHENENYQRMIQMALDRGLKLAFRVYVDSRDAFVQATPDYVFEAGAKGYANNEHHDDFLTPYLYDPVFQEKLANFVQAFAKEYDDPSIVDYIDAQGLGFWGEMHSIGRMRGSQKKKVFEWITNLYSDHFKHVLLGQQYGQNSFKMAYQDWALREKGYVIRRDSFGSPIWLKRSQKKQILAHWPHVPVFAENCYHGFKWREEWYKGDGFPTLYDMMQSVIQDAEELHANTLDLRYPQDATLWTETAPELVRYFALNCGYRFGLKEIEYPSTVKIDQLNTVKHIWQNHGFGMLPNNNPKWNWKYKPSFALLDLVTGKVVHQIIDNAEPSEWVGTKGYDYITEVSIKQVQPGQYNFAVAIINQENETKPEIELAIEGERTEEGWHVIGLITVE